MATVTPTTNAVFIPEVWSANILAATEDNLVLANLVSRWDADVKQAGDVIHIPNLANVTAVTKTPGTPLTAAANTETEDTITVDQWKAVYMVIEDMTKAQSNYDLMKLYTDKIGFALAEAIDTSIAGLYSGLSQSVSAAAALEDSEVITAVGYLDAANAPRDDRAFVIHSEVMADLRGVDKFITYDNTGSKGVQTGAANGLVANVYGVDVYMSNNIVEAAGTPNILHNLMFHKEAFGLALQKAPSVESDRSLSNVGDELLGQTLYGVAELRDTFGVDVQVNS